MNLPENIPNWLIAARNQLHQLFTNTPSIFGEIVLPADSPSWPERLGEVSLTEQGAVRIAFVSQGLVFKDKQRIEQELIKQIVPHLPAGTPVIVYFQSQNGAHAESPQRRPQKPDTPPKAPSGPRPIAGVRHIIAVASGKGGVGKSTVSVNLALALHNQGYRVGILDADIYGPSIPTMLGVHQDPTIDDNNKIIPPVAHGLQVMSFGFFAPEETAVIWRGPMIMKALQQFFWDVAWGYGPKDGLDFLVIDLPPGTGDAQLTLVQSIPLSGAVVVTTPQNVALLDAVKGIAMFRKTNVPVLGVVENMSSFTCPVCSTETAIFGQGGGQTICQKFDVPLLGQVPLIPEIREAGDSGVPLVTIRGHGLQVRFSEVAEAVVRHLGQP